MQLRGKTFYQTLVSYVQIVAISLLFAIILRSCLFEPFKIPSESMKPNILAGDYVIVSKYPYGYGKYSFSVIPMYIDKPMFDKEPVLGDIIVFRSNDPLDQRTYIKRLVGLPGDVIQMINGELYINNVLAKKTLIRTISNVNIDGYELAINEYEEELPNGIKYKVWYNDGLDNDQFPNTTRKYLIPQNRYFFMGDNRCNSHDSRYENSIGFVPKNNLIGRAEMVIWNSNGSLIDAIKGKPQTSVERVFSALR